MYECVSEDKTFIYLIFFYETGKNHVINQYKHHTIIVIFSFTVELARRGHRSVYDH